MDNRHNVSVTGIIEKDGKYLICKRSMREKAFPGKWCVPGGKVEKSDYEDTPKDTDDHWLDILEKTLVKEIREETGLEVSGIGYVSSLVFIRKDGVPTIIISMSAKYKSGEVMLNEELTDHAWVDLDEARDSDLIENIYEQIEKVDSRYRLS